MAYNNPLVIARCKNVFIKEETTPGTLVLPSASDFIIMTDFPTMDQQQDTTPVEAVQCSRTRLEVVFNNFGYGTLTGLSVSARVPGTAGSSPTAGQKTLLKAALGKVTDSSTSTVDAIAISAGTAANPVVLTVGAHTFQKGDKVTIANCTETDFNGDHVLASVTSTTLTTETDGSLYGGAASDGDVTLNMARFELAEELPYFSVWMSNETGSSTTGGAVMMAFAGCQINAFDVEFAKDGELQYVFGIDFQRRYFAGTAELSATLATSGTTMTFDSATYDVDNLFFVGQQVNIIDPAGSATLDSPVTVSAVNSGANTVTIGAASITNGPMPIGAIVSPYLPVGVISGNIIEQRNNKIYLGPADTDYGQASGDLIEATYNLLSKTGSISLAQTLQKPLEKELTGDEYPSAQFIPDTRDVTGNVTIAFRMNDQNYYQSLATTPRRALAFTVGNTEGSIIEFYLPKSFLNIPTDSVEEGNTILDIAWNAIEPSLGAERELMIVYR